MSQLQDRINALTYQYAFDRRLADYPIEENAAAFYKLLKENHLFLRYFTESDAYSQKLVLYEYLDIQRLGILTEVQCQAIFEKLDAVITEQIDNDEITIDFEAIITEVIGTVTLTALVTTIILGIVRLLFPNKVYKVVYSVGKTFEKLGKFLTSKGKQYQFVYATIAKNTLDCYKQCGVDPAQLKQLGYLTTGYGQLYKFKNLRTYEDVEKARCLQQCYIQALLYQIKLLLTQYFECLKKTNELNNLKKINKDNAMEVLLTYLPNSCEEYHKYVEPAFEQYKAFVQIIYSDKYYDPQARTYQHKYLTALNNAILEAYHKAVQ